MAKKDELAFEGGVESASSKPNNSEKLKALQAALFRIRIIELESQRMV